MSFITRPIFALTATMIGLAALLGGSLGIVAAHQGSLEGPSAGRTTAFNLVGGPFFEDMAPTTFMSCIPTTAWVSIYIWDAGNQEWKHFFNPATVPAYVNAPSAGGIDTIKKLAGLVVLSTQAVPNAKFKDRASDTC